MSVPGRLLRADKSRQIRMIRLLDSYFQVCFVLFCFVLFCFVLFCFVLFCFIIIFLFFFLKKKENNFLEDILSDYS